MSRINDIETRLSAIAKEIELEGADVNALAKETDELMEERQTLLDEIETRKATLAKVASLPEKELEPVVKEEKMEEKKKILYLWLPHTLIDQVDYHLGEALGYLYQGNFEDSLPKFELLLDMAETIPRAYKILPENIL